MTKPAQGHKAISEYLARVQKLPMLTREEEHDLAVRARAGDAAARERLVRHGLSMVVSEIRKFGLGSVPLEDVIQEGNLGLIRSLETFDPDAGTRLATYAVWWIRAYVSKYLKEARSIVRPRGGTVAAADLSLDSPMDEDDDTTYLERVEDQRPGAEQVLMERQAEVEVRETLARHRSRIGPLGWDIVQSRIQCDQPESLESLGLRWGLSRERVRQVELRTKKLLCSFLGDRPAA